MIIQDKLLYTPTHEWLSQNGATATVGISDHAQALLGDLVFIELPEIGRLVKVGEAMAVVESVKAASDIYAPVSGEVVEVNESLLNNPEAVNKSPYDGGWLFRLKLVNLAEVEALLSPAAYAKTIAH